MGNIIHIAETAFISILVSAVEAFPSKYEGKKKPKDSFPEGEVYGLLFGQRISKNSNKIYHVTIATPMQTLFIKTENEVHPSVRHFERIKAVIEAYPMYQFLGTFHSHPYRKGDYNKDSSDFSEIDEETALEEAKVMGDEVIEVIIGLTYLDRAISKTPLNEYWHRIENYCGNYKYCIAAYVTDSENERLSEVDNLICPFAYGIGNYDLIPEKN